MKLKTVQQMVQVAALEMATAYTHDVDKPSPTQVSGQLLALAELATSRAPSDVLLTHFRSAVGLCPHGRAHWQHHTDLCGPRCAPLPRGRNEWTQG